MQLQREIELNLFTASISLPTCDYLAVTFDLFLYFRHIPVF